MSEQSRKMRGTLINSIKLNLNHIESEINGKEVLSIENTEFIQMREWMVIISTQVKSIITKLDNHIVPDENKPLF
jgi:hypothetical protein